MTDAVHKRSTVRNVIVLKPKLVSGYEEAILEHSIDELGRNRPRITHTIHAENSVPLPDVFGR